VRSVHCSWGIFDLGDNGGILVAKGGHEDRWHYPGAIWRSWGNNASRWPLKHSGLSGYVVYFGRCDAG
jgi:hypothetical protein